LAADVRGSPSYTEDICVYITCNGSALHPAEALAAKMPPGAQLWLVLQFKHHCCVHPL